MRFERLHALVSYLLAGLGLFALTLGNELDSLAVGGMAIGYVASLFVGRAQLNHPRYTATWNAVIVVFLGLQIARAFTGASILSLGIEFAAGLQIAKLFHRVGARDYQHIQALAMLHLVAATVLTTGLEYAIVFVGFVIVLPWMLALSHLRGEIETHYVAPDSKLPPGLGPPSPKAREVLRSRRIAGASFLGWTAALSVPLFVVTAAFFALFPRVGLGFLSFGEAQGRQVAGFGGDVQLGGFGVIRDDATVVVRVRPAQTTGGGTRTFRLRGTSFDRYQDARWSRSAAGPTRIDEMLGYYPLTRRSRRSGTEELEIVLDPLDERVIFLPTGTIGVYAPPRLESGFEVFRRLELAPGFDLRYRESDGLDVHYTAVIDENLRTTPEALRDGDLERYLQLPGDVSAIAGVARQKAGAGSPATQAAALEAWLKSSGEYSYSLRMPDTRGRDPLQVFLLEARSGHCEYFSTALAVMLRTLGIPARNVTGFVGGTYNRFGDYYAVRQGDAHSWVEAYVDGEWHTFDPTPAAHMSAGPQTGGFLGQLSAMLDAMRMRWSRNVVGYDLRDQVDGLRSFLRWFREIRGPAESSESGQANEGEPASTPRSFRPLTLASLVLAALAAVWWWRRRKKKSSPSSERAIRPDASDARDLYLRLERRLRRRGVARPSHQTPREHLETLEAAGDEDIELIRAVTEAYEWTRLGGRPVDPEAIKALRRRLRFSGRSADR